MRSSTFKVAVAAALSAATNFATAEQYGPQHVTIVNKHNESIIAWETHNEGPSFEAPLVSGFYNKTIPPNGSSTYLIDQHWAGSWQIATVSDLPAVNTLTGTNSLIEGSLMPNNGLFLDISNV